MRSVLEIAMGLLFAVGAVFNTVYTRSHAAEFYESFVARAWLEPGRRFMRSVVLPNAAVVTVLVIVIQLAVAGGILSRGDLVRPALLVGAGFALGGALVSSPGGAFGNAVLGGLQLVLALTR